MDLHKIDPKEVDKLLTELKESLEEINKLEDFQKFQDLTLDKKLFKGLTITWKKELEKTMNDKMAEEILNGLE